MADRRIWWERLAAHKRRLDVTRTTAIFANERDRMTQFSEVVADTCFDFSKHKIDQPALQALLAFAEDTGLAQRIDDLFAGAVVNPSERRPALHAALRAAEQRQVGATDVPAFEAARQSATQTLAQCRQLVETLRQQFGADGFDVVHVGIGGSELGPKLCLEALTHPRSTDTVRVHYVGNVDAHPVDHLIATLDPKRTVVCLVSKSFGTQETLTNGAILRRWLESSLGAELAATRLIAITANPARAVRYGIDETQVLPIWDWVGGRYSVWSAVSLSTMLALGYERFAEFLAGAEAMDLHFRMAPFARNVPVLMGLVGVWSRNVLGLPGHCVVPYDERLRHLPAFLQQLEMESNGKSVTPDGSQIGHATVPIIWGGVGSATQHAFFQALHQGELANVVEFIGAVQPAHEHDASHQALMANMLAQSSALLHGRQTDDTDPALRAQRECPGDRPSTTILLPELTPFTLGLLLGAYEHKVFVQSVLWGNNAFDQWGVELGKQLADEILPLIEGRDIPDGVDASTRMLIGRVRGL